VTIDTGASVTIARPDTVEGQAERKPSRAYNLRNASGKTIPVLKEALVELTLGRQAMRNYVFVAEVTNESSWG